MYNYWGTKCTKCSIKLEGECCVVFVFVFCCYFYGLYALHYPSGGGSFLSEVLQGRRSVSCMEGVIVNCKAVKALQSHVVGSLFVLVLSQPCFQTHYTKTQQDWNESRWFQSLAKYSVSINRNHFWKLGGASAASGSDTLKGIVHLSVQVCVCRARSGLFYITANVPMASFLTKSSHGLKAPGCSAWRCSSGGGVETQRKPTRFPSRATFRVESRSLGFKGTLGTPLDEAHQLWKPSGGRGRARWWAEFLHGVF